MNSQRHWRQTSDWIEQDADEEHNTSNPWPLQSGTTHRLNQSNKGITCFFFEPDTKIGNEGAEALMEALDDNSTLRSLDLRSNRTHKTRNNEQWTMNNNPDVLTGNEIEPHLKRMIKTEWGQRSGYLWIWWKVLIMNATVLIKSEMSRWAPPLVGFPPIAHLGIVLVFSTCALFSFKTIGCGFGSQSPNPRYGKPG